jgi:hypothetical protein
MLDKGICRDHVIKRNVFAQNERVSTSLKNFFSEKIIGIRYAISGNRFPIRDLFWLKMSRAHRGWIFLLPWSPINYGSVNNGNSLVNFRKPQTVSAVSLFDFAIWRQEGKERVLWYIASELHGYRFLLPCLFSLRFPFECLVDDFINPANYNYD